MKNIEDMLNDKSIYEFDSDNYIEKRLVNTQKKVNSKMRQEFRKISRDDLLNNCLTDIYVLNIHFMNGEKPSAEIFPEIDHYDTLIQGINDFFIRGFNYQKQLKQEDNQLSYIIEKSLREENEGNEYWCSIPEVYIDFFRRDGEDLYQFIILEYNKEQYDKEFNFQNAIHPFMESLKYRWMHNWQEKNYDEMYRRAAKSTNKLLVSIFDHVNILSTYRYEGAVNYGVLILIPPSEADILVELELPIKLSSYKSIRKLLAMCGKGVSLLVNEDNEAYGLGKNIPEKIYPEVEFLGYFSWRLSFEHEELMSCTNLQPQLPNKQKYRENIRTKLNETFGKNNFDKKAIMDVIDIAKQQMKGTMLVVSENAEDEAKRLVSTCMLVKPTKINREVTRHLTEIDGAILINSACICYGIGVILDGEASESGDISRGARYNSAIRYLTRQKKKDAKCLIVVVSEDQYVDIVSVSDITLE